MSKSYDIKRVVIHVRGGVAYADDVPEGVEVEIIDHDNEGRGEEEERTITQNEKRYAATYWTIGDLAETLKSYYGEDFELTDERLCEIMEKIESQLIDDVCEHGNDNMQNMAISIIEEAK